MHWNTEQILWALVLAAHLVLLVVLLGRDRTKSFPWFTASIVIATVRLLADHLLNGKLTAVAFYWQSYTASIVASLIGLVVLRELARMVFASGKAGKILNAKGWAGGFLLTLAIAAVAVWLWGPWPALATLRAEPALFSLRLVWLTASKLDVLVGVLAIELTVLLLLFGRRFGFPLATHAQQIAIGLSTAAISRFAVAGISEAIKKSVHLTSQEQYDHVVRILTNLDNARFALWFLVVVWWTAWLWRDERGPGDDGPSPADDLMTVGIVPGITPMLGAEMPEEPA
jgi:hypothetical protein